MWGLGDVSHGTASCGRRGIDTQQGSFIGFVQISIILLKEVKCLLPSILLTPYGLGEVSLTGLGMLHPDEAVGLFRKKGFSVKRDDSDTFIVELSLVEVAG
jgi:hypothetical protein